MSMSTWAEREVKLACEKERGKSSDPEDWDYGCACYESALKAYKCLCDDGHSGYSFSITRQILDRLMAGEPLTPIEDTPDVWNLCFRDKDGKTTYQCKRKSSLFKNIDTDGNVTYSDCDAFPCVNVNDKLVCHSGLVNRIMEELFPITMPYTSRGAIKVYCDDILTDGKNGDFDTVAIYYAIKPDGERLEINRFFKEGGKDWVEISHGEYNARCVSADLRKEKEESDKIQPNACCNLEV